MKKNLVLTILTKYTYRKIEPFFRTLRKTGYDGDIVVFYDLISEKTIEKMKKWSPILIKFNSEEFSKEGIQVVHYRFKLFYDFLLKDPEKYDKVLICDIRDLVFQKNPFEYGGYSNLNYFCESKKVKENSINSYTLSEAGGKDAFEKYGDNYTICAGTTLGNTTEMLEYLKLMSSVMRKGNPIDQGQHIYFFYSGRFPNSKGFLNFEGPILTIGELKEFQLIYNKSGDLVNKDGTIINVIHQYDRSGKLLKKFNNPGYFFLDLAEYRYTALKKFIKKILFNIPGLKGYFKKKYFNPSEV